MMRRGWTVLTGAVLLVILGGLVARMPVPYVELGPGPTYNTVGSADGKELIKITGHSTSTSAGHLNMTTVSVADGLNLFEAMRGWVDSSAAVVPRELIFPPQETTQQTEKKNAADFKQSQSSAETAALREAGYPVLVSVKSVASDSPSYGTLKVGDVITAVDGTTVTTSQKLVSILDKVKPGTTVEVAVRRGTAERTVHVTTGSAGDGGARHAILGIGVDQTQPHPFTITFELDKVGGPSAGLMFSLGIVDKLDPTDLTGGAFIAGTGTIDDEGNVGPIGGIQEKLIGARRAGATIFLTPADNCAEAATAVPAGLRLVKVSSLDDALTALRQLRDHTGQPAGC